MLLRKALQYLQKFFFQSEMSEMLSRIDNVLYKMKHVEDQLKQLCQGQDESARLVQAIANKSGVEINENITPKSLIKFESFTSENV